MASLTKTLRQNPITDYIGSVIEKKQDGVKIRIGSRIIMAKSAINTPILKGMRVVVTKTESGWRVIGIEESIKRNIKELEING